VFFIFSFPSFSRILSISFFLVLFAFSPPSTTRVRVLASFSSSCAKKETADFFLEVEVDFFSLTLRARQEAKDERGSKRKVTTRISFFWKHYAFSRLSSAAAPSWTSLRARWRHFSMKRCVEETREREKRMAIERRLAA
jgi:hypothetical protein